MFYIKEITIFTASCIIFNVMTIACETDYNQIYSDTTIEYVEISVTHFNDDANKPVKNVFYCSFKPCDLKDGYLKRFSIDGDLTYFCQVRDGVFNGFFKSYRKDGSLLYIGEYTNGEKSGTWRHYDENGTLTNEETHSISSD